MSTDAITPTPPQPPSPAPPASPPPAKPPSAVWKWIKRIGCGLLLLTLTCCGSVCGGAWWLDHSVANMNKDEVDRLHAEGLHGGDLAAIHKHADERFRQKFTLEDLQALLQKRPDMFQRDQLQGVDFVKQKIDGVEFVKVRSRRGWFTGEMHDIVFKIIDGVYVLVGISPGMDEFVPLGFRFRISGGGGRHRIRFWRH